MDYTFGQWLFIRRKMWGLTQSDMAKKLHMNEHTYRGLEIGGRSSQRIRFVCAQILLYNEIQKFHYEDTDAIIQNNASDLMWSGAWGMYIHKYNGRGIK